MTNAMPFLQMTIKLSYGWRPLRSPAVTVPVRSTFVILSGCEGSQLDSSSLTLLRMTG